MRARDEMTRSRCRAILPILVAVALLAAVGASAEERVVSTLLGRDGQLLTLIQGTYGELFPDGNEAQSDITVLALRRTSPSGVQELAVVPATLDAETEEAPVLVFEPDSGVAYVFWQSWINSIHSHFKIAAFDGESWAEPIEVSGPAFAWRTSPAFAVTRDSYSDLSTADGSSTTAKVHRTVLHIVWSEAGDEGRWNTLYAPLVLEDGRYIGQHPVLVLNDLVTAPDADASSDLQIAPVLRQGVGENSVIAAFLDQRSNRLAAIELRFAAGELSILGDLVSDMIGEASSLGAEQLAAKVGSTLLSYTNHLKPEILGPLASSVEELVRDRATAGDAVQKLSGEARAQLVDVGIRLTDGRMHRMSGDARAQLVDVGVRTEGPRPGHHHDARSAIARTLSPPSVPARGTRLLVSSSGTKQILAWRQDSRVRYRESLTDSEWSKVQQIQLGASLDYDKAIAILQQRVDQ